MRQSRHRQAAVALPDFVSAAEKSSWLEDYASFSARLPANEPSALAQLRHSAIGRFEAIGFPRTSWEQWRFTDVAPITRTAFRRSESRESDISPVQMVPFSYVECGELVFINGHYCPTYSSLCELPEEAVLGNLADGLRTHPEKVQAHLGRYASFEENAFVALNTAFLGDGAFVYIPRNAVVEEPIHLLYLSTGSGEPTVSYPRNLIITDEGSEVTIVESYAGTGHNTYLTCPVTEIVTGEGAVVEHYRLQHESSAAYHVATQQLYMAGGSTVTSQSISFGGGFVRNDISAVLNGEGADCTLNGFYLIKGRQFLDNHLTVEHARPGCKSRQLYKGILEDRSRAVFNGRIHVHPDAQQTDAEQTNRNLLLSEKAMVNSNPQLEIFADDVKCTHGSATGQLDEDALFYLRSRGIAEEAARSLLIYAFASESIERVEFRPVRKDLKELLLNRLPQGEIVRQAV